MAFSSEQALDKWVTMLDNIYGKTQNYNKDKYEVFSHLIEVVGGFGKYYFKKKDYAKAITFLPKMFAWAVMLFYKVKGTNDMRNVILKKYPGACHYCNTERCKCIPGGKKQKPNLKLLKEFYNSRVRNDVNSLSDFQKMFEAIYERTWGLSGSKLTIEERENKLRILYIRMQEELSEIAESIRFNHINESNFLNEFADYFAWWIAIISSAHYPTNGKIKRIDIEPFIWSAYPGYCLVCCLKKCDCRPGPVRDLLSKPSAFEDSLRDPVTLSYNATELKNFEEDVVDEKVPVIYPITFITIDLVGLGFINNNYGDDTGDEILLLIANSIRSKIFGRQILYRSKIRGDEFLIVCQDFSAEEAEGLTKRIKKAVAVNSKDYRAKNLHTKKVEPLKTEIRFGVSTCENIFQFKQAISVSSKKMLVKKKRIPKVK